MAQTAAAQTAQTAKQQQTGKQQQTAQTGKQTVTTYESMDHFEREDPKNAALMKSYSNSSEANKAKITVKKTVYKTKADFNEANKGRKIHISGGGFRTFKVSIEDATLMFWQNLVLT